MHCLSSQDCLSCMHLILLTLRRTLPRWEDVGCLYNCGRYFLFTFGPCVWVCMSGSTNLGLVRSDDGAGVRPLSRKGKRVAENDSVVRCISTSWHRTAETGAIYQRFGITCLPVLGPVAQFGVLSWCSGLIFGNGVWIVVQSVFCGGVGLWPRLKWSYMWGWRNFEFCFRCWVLLFYGFVLAF